MRNSDILISLDGGNYYVSSSPEKTRLVIGHGMGREFVLRSEIKGIKGKRFSANKVFEAVSSLKCSEKQNLAAKHLVSLIDTEEAKMVADRYKLVHGNVLYCLIVKVLLWVKELFRSYQFKTQIKTFRLREIADASLVKMVFDRNQKHVNSEEETFDYERFFDHLCLYNQNFEVSYDPETAIGLSRKIHLNRGDVIIGRADIHADWKGFASWLAWHQKKGYLDKNFRCRPDVHFVLHGDFTDRNPYNLHVLEFLVLWRQQNPANVHLIRGNHDRVSSNKHMLQKHSDVHFSRFLGQDESDEFSLDETEENVEALKCFYQSLSTVEFLGCDEEGPKEYIACVHGIMDPSQSDFGKFLDNPELIEMPIPKVTPETYGFDREKTWILDDEQFANQLIEIGSRKDLSNRDIALAMKRLKKVKKAAEATRRFFDAMPNPFDDFVKLYAEPFKEELGEDYDEYREKIASLPLEKKMAFINRDSSFFWGDLGLENDVGERKNAAFTVSAEQAYHTLTLASGEKNSVGFFLGGHLHQFLHHMYAYQDDKHQQEKEKFVGMTLPSLGIKDGRDGSVIIQVGGPKLKSWKVQEIREDQNRKGYMLGAIRGLKEIPPTP